MTKLLDELARSLATPMPRSRAVRVLGAALVSAAVPASLRPGIAHAGRSGSAQCPPKPTCPKSSDPKRTKFCGVPNIGNDKCLKYRYVCCLEKERCCGAACCSPCRTTQTVCGDACCRKKDEYCASPEDSLCCLNTEDACLVLGAPGLPRPSKGGTCCPRGASKCCQNDKRSTCCKPEDSCCAGGCCPPAKECDTKTGTCSCPKSTKACGRDCCTQGKNPEKCCGNHCCEQKEQCCGETCCKPSEGESCCSGGCCKKGEFCMTTTTLRALHGGSSPSSRSTISRVCCTQKRKLTPTFCCPEGTVAGRTRLTRTCCPSGNPNCCGELGCGPGERCVRGNCKR